MAASTSVMNSTDVVIMVASEIVGKMTSASLSVTMATRAITPQASEGWLEVLEGQKSWTLSGEGLVVYNNTGKATPDDIYTLLSNRTAVAIEFGSETTDEKYYTGSGFFTEFSTDAGVEDNATFSFSFQGTGVLTQGTQS